MNSDNRTSTGKGRTAKGTGRAINGNETKPSSIKGKGTGRKRKGKKLPAWGAALIIIIAIAIFIFTPTKNPLETTVSGSAFDYKLCLPAEDGSIIYHPNYWLSYSEEDEQARWVATVLTAENILAPTVERTNKFIPDPDIVTKSAVTGDYSSTGFDRGHILSFASNGWNEEVGAASFYMSNMSPQRPSTNRYTYERLEEAERSATVQNGVLFVVHGPVLTDGPYEKIGKSTKISVPNTYFVCFLDYTGQTTKAIGFLIPNDDVNYSDITRFAVPVNQIEELAGIDFWPLLPDDVEEELESQCDISAWELSPFNRTRLAAKYGYDLENLGESHGFYEEREPADLKEEILYFLYQNFAGYKLEILGLFN